MSELLYIFPFSILYLAFGSKSGPVESVALSLSHTNAIEVDFEADEFR